MKLLLVAVNAKYIHSNLAVYSLRSYAKKYEDQIGLVEYTINHSEEDILKGIYMEKADIIAFSCYIWNIELITRIMIELRKVQPKVRIWFGGPEVSYDAKECLQKHKELDGVMMGEGEQTFLELMEYYVDGTKNLSEIDGLAYKQSAGKENTVAEDKGNVVITKPRQPISLDEIPFPYTDLGNFQNRIIYYESSRGCPFSCSYCLSSIDKRVRQRSMELVRKELKLLMELQVPQIKFVDRTFNCNKKHTMELWQFIKEHDNGITNFHFEISADLLEEEEIEFLATLRPGQVQFEIGVQTTNPETMKAIHRKMDFDKLSYNVGRIKEGKNIHQHLDLIAGLPFEGYTSFEKSFQDVYHLRPDQLQLGFLKILKGSLMETESKTYHIVYRDTAPYEVLFTKHLTYEEMLRIKGMCEMLEIYYNSGQFSYAIRFLENFYTSPMQLYQAIYDYYESRRMDQLAHSRIRRYEILLDFYKEKILATRTPAEQISLTGLFEEILILDLYLREDMKSRPSFAAVPSQDRKLRDQYEKCKREHKLFHIEQFTFDVIVSVEEGKAVKKDTIFMFDYSNRDPLNKSAKLVLLQEEL